jgi:hypothetical protein
MFILHEVVQQTPLKTREVNDLAPAATKWNADRRDSGTWQRRHDWKYRIQIFDRSRW